jgi:flagellar biosynthesis protein FlhA
MKIIVRKYSLEILPQVNKELLNAFFNNEYKNISSKIIPNDILRLEIGSGLIPLCNKTNKNNIMDGIKNIRKRIIDECGVSIPSIHIIDNRKLNNFAYCLYINNKKIFKYNIPRNKFLCLDDGTVINKINGKETLDPVFGVKAWLINKDQINIAADDGYVIADPSRIILTSIEHNIKKNFFMILNYDKSKSLLMDVNKFFPRLVKDIKKIYNLFEIKEILVFLLKNKISLGNIEIILEEILFLGKELNKNDLLVNIQRRLPYKNNA